MLHTVIMAGGSGTRFWPQSRRALPKQFLSMGAEKTLLQDTADRCLPLIGPDGLWIVTGAAHAAETARQLPELSANRILVEPCGRNTAPCIALAAIQLLAVDPDAVMLVVPADHVIRPSAVFQDAVRHAERFVSAAPDSLVLFGVKPNFPSTGFGYIERGNLHTVGDTSVFEVRAFKEKPDAITAERYVADGNFDWNCGIFVWRADTILSMLERYEPEIAVRTRRLQAAIGTFDWENALAAEFPAMPSISIDYAVLERAPEVFVLPAPFQWDDVGSWQALSRLRPADADGNTVDGLHAGISTKNCIIRSTAEHLVATIGITNLIVVHTPTATLVADRRDESAVKALLAELERRGLQHFL